MDVLLERFDNKEAVIGILGLGYVGIPLGVSISNAGFRVIGFDVVDQRAALLNNGISPIKHISNTDIEQMCKAGFEATTDFSQISDCDVIIICVPTPLNKTREPDLSIVASAMEMITPYMRKNQLLSLESTTWPGTTRQILLPFIEAAGFDVGEDYFLVYSPEREDPGNQNYTTRTIPKVIGGHTSQCSQVGRAFYATFIDQVVPVSSTEASELVKLLENIHRSVNIGLVNEMKVVADAMGLDIFEIIDAAKTKPFGFTAYYPGPGIGGHCIPIDPFYLTWKAREFGLNTHFIELAGEINASMPQYVVDKTVRALNHVGKSLKGANVLALGIAYKRDIDDMRESPSVYVMELLREWGANVAYSDPNVPVFPQMRDHQFDLKSVALDAHSIAGFDAVILLTDHSDFDYGLIEQHARVLVDTRGRFSTQSEHITRA